MKCAINNIEVQKEIKMQSNPRTTSISETPSVSQKKAYEMPQMRNWGNIEKITQVGLTTPGTDTLPSGFDDDFGGSVTPGG
jgi:hypothetical protein